MGCPRSDELCPASASWCDFLGKESREAAELPCCAVLCCAQGVGSLLEVGDAHGVQSTMACTARQPCQGQLTLTIAVLWGTL